MCVYVCVLLAFGVAIVSDRMIDTQRPAATIKVASGDPLYLSFLPALDTAMAAAWHQPKVRVGRGGACWCCSVVLLTCHPVTFCVVVFLVLFF